MRRLDSEASGNHGFQLLKRVLSLPLILSFLVVFSFSFADDLNDPPPGSEHPWDDVCETTWDNPQIPPGGDDVLILQFGFGPCIIIHVQSSDQEQGAGVGKAGGPSQENHGNLFIFAR